MTNRFSIPAFFALLLIVASCSSQEPIKKSLEPTAEEQKPLIIEKEPHRYGGWYCPDNFGFIPVDVQKLDEVPAISDRLPTEQELQDHMSLIKVDTEKYPDARALKMDLPRVARVYSQHKDMSELVIVIQAIVVQEDTVVGYRFANGGNGSAWLSDVTFLSENEVAGMGAQPFFYSSSVIKAKAEDIWRAISNTDYFEELGEKFNEQAYFSSDWNPDSRVRLNLDIDGEKAKGYVGMVFGNCYLHIDYDRDGFHYSEKLLMIENTTNNTTELFFASGPYPKDFDTQKVRWDNWFKTVKRASEIY